MNPGSPAKLTLRLIALLLVVAALSGTATFATGVKIDLYAPAGRLSALTLSEQPPGFSISQEPRVYLQDRVANLQLYTTLSEKGDMVVTQEYVAGSDQAMLPTPVSTKSYSSFLAYSQLDTLWNNQARTSLQKSDEERSGGLLKFDIPWKSQPRLVRSIIGEGGAGLQVNGYRKITISGKSQWTDQTSVATQKQSKFPSLNMEQIASFQIQGSIGSKITVDVNQDSKRQQSLANKIILRYKGDEDDVIKTIELGNTNLSLPSTRFIGYSQSIQGLFGVKATAQVGALELTAIASQEKSSNEGATFSAGSESSERVIRDWDYLDNRYFDLRPHPELYPDGTKLPTDLQPGDSIILLRLYLPTQLEYAPQCSLYVDPVSRDSFPDGVLVRRCFDEDEYEAETHQTVEYIYHPTEHYIRIDRPTISSYVGIYMEVLRGVDTVKIGDINRPDSTFKILKMLRHENPKPNYVTWNYIWRNVYQVGGQIDDIDNFDLKIYKGQATNIQDRDISDLDYTTGGEYYIQTLGLDTNPKDGKIDRSNQIIDQYMGHIFFPSRRPFLNPALGADTVPEIYFESNSRIKQDSSKFYLVVNSSSRQSEFSLGHFDIVEGSETVTLNGRRLTKDVDYRILYEIGKIQFLTDDALDPNANVQVDYEYAPLITSEKKTLLGMRGEYKRGRNFKMGSTVLYKSEKTTDRKPRLGEEQSRFMNLDSDLSYSFESQMLTDLMNKLPLIDSKATSRVQFAGEVGQSFPNPNVQGEAYLDDFEGVQERYALGVTRGGWHSASMPLNVSDTTHGSLIWYNPYNQYRITDIYDREVSAGEDRTHVLVMRFAPKGSNADESWGGVMRAFSAGVFDQTLTKFIELRMLGKRGVLHIDLGEISEDINGDGVKNTEDVNSNGILDEGEDVGLDGLPDAEEVCPPVNCNTSDPSNDNWQYDSNDPNNYEHINGTEGNAKDPDSYGLPDTEDLNRSGFLDGVNNYYSFRVNLDPDSNDFLVEGSENDKGWYTVRIPFQELGLYDSLGNPDRSDIRYVRLWLDGVDAGDTAFVTIADLELTHNLWQPRDILSSDEPRDTIIYPAPEVRVAVVNTEENVDYSPPAGVQGFLDKTTGLREKEQSLSIQFDNFIPGDTGMAEKIPYRPEDLTGYRKLEMWVHGDSLRNNIRYFLRVGPDAQNYYEYSTTVMPGWDEAHSVAMVFDEMTPLKLTLQELKQEYPDTNQITEGPYRIVGNPSLTKVKYYAIGVLNVDSETVVPPDSGSTKSNQAVMSSLGGAGSEEIVPVTGIVWFDELRLTNVRTDHGLAAYASGSITFGDVMSVSADYSRQDAYFRKLTGAGRGNLGSGREVTAQGYRVTFQLDRVMPQQWQASIPISYSRSKSIQTPRLVTGSDIVVPQNRLEEERSTSTSWDFSIRESFRGDPKNPVFSLLLNNFKSSFSYSNASSKTPTDPVNSSERYTAQGSYDLSQPRKGGLKIFSPLSILFLPSGVTSAGLWPFPTRLSFSGTLARSLEIRVPASGTRTERFTRTLKGRVTSAAEPFSGMQLTYSMDTDRNLEDPELVRLSLSPKQLKLGQERTYKEGFSASWSPRFISFITGTRMNFSATHSENLDPQQQVAGTRRVDNGRSLTLGATLNLESLVGKNKPRTAQQEPSQPLMSRNRRREPIIDTLRVVSDSTEADSTGPEIDKRDEEPKVPGIPVYEYPLRLVRFITGRFNPVSGQYKVDKRISRNGFLGRPSLLYRLGLSNDPGVGTRSVVGSAAQVDVQSKALAYSLSSGVDLPLGITVGTRWSKSTREETNRNTRDISTTFPDLDFNLSNLFFLKFTNFFSSSFKLDSKYTRTENKSVDRVTGAKENGTISRSYSPLISANINWRFSSAFSTTVKLDRSTSERQKFYTGGEDLGKLQTNTIDYSSGVTVSNAYTFRGGSKVSLPLFGSMTIKTNMSLNLDVSKTSQKSEKHDPGKEVSELDATSDLTVQARASYSFSTNIKGGLTARWRDSNSKKTNRTTHLRELGFWAEIRF